MLTRIVVNSNLVFNEIEYFTYLNLWLSYLIFWLLFILLLIQSSLLFNSIYRLNDLLVELLLTIIAMWFLWFIISPSIIMLLDYDLLIIPSFIVYCLGYQWAWTFTTICAAEFSSSGIIIANFDQYVTSSINAIVSKPDNYKHPIYSKTNSKPRRQRHYLIEVNKYLINPLWSSTKFIVLSFDVIHSIGLYSFGIKLDAIPGRIHLSSIAVLLK
jgi:heme/copper-type cytochrome/quinol oxidase subunit 2